MAISYVKTADGTASVTAAEKIELMYLGDIINNPWLVHRAVPYQSEGRTLGGGIYKFRTPLGEDLPARRANAPTNSTVTYDGVIKNTEVELSVSQPFETKAYPMENGDLVQLDGINYSDVIARSIVEQLVKVEIATDTAAVVDNADILTVDGSAATTGLDKLKFIKDKIANYYAIDADNADWAAATSTTKAYDYFTGKTGTFAQDQIRVHVHPATFMELSNAVTEAGAGSDMQYQEFVSGKVPMIGGVQIVINKYIGKDEAIIMPVNMIGTPDLAVMTTRIVDHMDELNFVEVMRGQHYFDSILTAPELITKVSFSGGVVPTPTYYTINCTGAGTGTCDVDTSGGTDFADDPTCGGTDFTTCTAK